MFINDKDITYINNITDKLYQYKTFIFVFKKKKKMYAISCMHVSVQEIQNLQKKLKNKKITKLFYITKQLKV